MIKNIIGVLLIIAMLSISAIGYLNDRKTEEVALSVEPTEQMSEEIEETDQYGDIKIDYDPREGTVIPIDNIEVVYDYLDPHETQNYEDLLTIYSSYLPLCVVDDTQSFFEHNKEDIGDVLGIYFIDEFNSLSEKLMRSGVTNESVPQEIEIIKLEQNGRLLNAHIRVFYDEATLDMSHNLDYVYIGTEAYLFLYSDGGDA